MLKKLSENIPLYSTKETTWGRVYDDREFIFGWTVTLSLPWNYKTISFFLYVILVIGCRLVLLFFWRWIVNLHTQTHCDSPCGLVNVLASHPQVDWQIWSTEDQCTLSCFWMWNSKHVFTLVHTFMMCHSCSCWTWKLLISLEYLLQSALFESIMYLRHAVSVA